MRSLKTVAVFVGILSIFGACNRTALTTSKVQIAVDTALDWTKKSGSAVIVGIREIPQENAATADIRFDGFQYNADQAGTPISKTQQSPSKPDINSPNFYRDLYNYGTQQTQVRSYSGPGVAILKSYSDGRWVLTEIQFNFVSVNSNIEIK